jgi:hypothetical protein
MSTIGTRENGSPPCACKPSPANDVLGIVGELLSFAPIRLRPARLGGYIRAVAAGDFAVGSTSHVVTPLDYEGIGRPCRCQSTWGIDSASGVSRELQMSGILEY